MKTLSVADIIGETNGEPTPESTLAYLQEAARYMGWSDEHVVKVAVALTVTAAAAWRAGQIVGVADRDDYELRLVVTQFGED